MSGCRPLTTMGLARLMDEMKGKYALRNRALVVVGVRTGFRIAELLSLRIGDVVREGKWLTRISVARREMKGGSAGASPSRGAAMLPIPRRLRGPLQAWRRRMKMEGLLSGRQGAWFGVDEAGALVAEPRLPGRSATSKNVKGRSVPMHPDVPAALGPWLLQARAMGFMRTEDYLFQSRAAGNRPITVQQAWRIFKAGLTRAGIHEGTGHQY